MAPIAGLLPRDFRSTGSRELLPQDHKDVLIAQTALGELDYQNLSTRQCLSPEMLEFRERMAHGEVKIYDIEKGEVIRQPWWDDGFHPISCKNRQDVYTRLGTDIGAAMSGMAEKDGGTFTLACGPVPNFEPAANEINRLGIPLGDKVLLRYMDDWAIPGTNGILLFQPGEPGSFATTFYNAFIKYIREDLRPSQDVLENASATVESLRARIAEQMKYEERGLNYGIGEAPHKAFVDPNQIRKLWEYGINPERVVFMAGVRITPETGSQNKGTGYPNGIPSEWCNTVGPYLIDDVPTFALGGCDGYHDEAGESWQQEAVWFVLGRKSLDLSHSAARTVMKPGNLYIHEKLLCPPSGEVH